MAEVIGSSSGVARRRERPSTGWAYAGSRRQIQAHVNTPSLTAALNAAVLDAWPDLAGGDIDWRAPLAAHRYREPMDSTFWSAIQRPDRENLAEAWWPRRGPSWDAIAVVTRDQQEPVVLLVEAKAHVAEFTVGQFAGTNTRSIEMITDALNRTREKLGAVRPVDAWLGEHYQLANRLAWTHWLRERDIDARYAYVLFAEDRSHKPTTAEDLRAAADAAYTALGVDPAQAHWVSDVVLDGIG